jgi:hypothetical protein
MPLEFVARNGIIGLANSTISGSLAVSQSVTAQSFTGSLSGSALAATSASYAQTASYANNFTVGGTLTAQTIVAQTITSSIEFITGSTRNGSLLTNTHQFTGSLFQTGSTAIFMGNVGIGTTSPTGSNTSSLLHVAGNSAVLRVGPYYSVGGDRDFVEIIAGGADTKVTSTNERFYLENTAGSIIISATNNIGIGTTVPSASLHISGTTGGVFEVDGAAAVNALYVSASGNVGIGTITPSRKLSVQTSTGTDAINWTDGTRNGYLYVDGSGVGVFSGTSATNQGMYLNNSTNVLSLWTNSTPKLTINSAGNVGVGTASPSYKLDISGSFRVSGSNGDFIVADTGNDIYLTRNGASYFIANQASSVISYLMGTGVSQSLFLANNGDVGIGTTSPTHKLNIAANGYNLRIANSPNLSGYNIGRNISDGLLYFYGDQTGFIGYVWTGADGERMRITSGGNVLIGTTTDGGYKLTVAGVINTTNTTGYLLRDNDLAGYGIFKGASTRIGIAANGNEYLSVLSTGNVGIGTTTPNSLLSVNGNASITGSVTSTVGFTGSLSGSASSATSASYALSSSFAISASAAISSSYAITSTTAATATSAGTVTGTSGQLTSKDDRIIEPNSITSARAQFGFTSWNNNNASPYADYLHLRSYTDPSGGNDNLISFNKSTIGMRIWQQSWNSASAYDNYRDVALVSGSATGYIPLYQSATVLTGSSIFQSGLNIGIGTTIPNSTLSVSGSASITGSLSVSADITGSNVRATTGVVSPNVTWSSTLGSNGGEIRISQNQFRNGAPNTIVWAGTSDSNAARDLGIRRNNTGSLEIYDGNTADGAIANRRDLLARNITGSNALISGSLTVSGSANISGSISLNGSVLSAVSGFQQTFSAATTWTVTHNLNTAYPVITVYDSFNRVVLPASITATSANVVTITFNVATAGSVNILSGQLQQNMVLSNPSAVAISTVLGG